MYPDNRFRRFQPSFISKQVVASTHIACILGNGRLLTPYLSPTFILRSGPEVVPRKIGRSLLLTIGRSPKGRCAALATELRIERINELRN